MKKLQSYTDALSRFDNGMTRIEVAKIEINDEDYKQNIWRLQQYKQNGLGSL